MLKYSYIPNIKHKSHINLFMVFVFLISTFLLVLIIPAGSSEALSGSQFNPGRIIDDAVFYNKNTMSAAQIQTFLNSKAPDCSSNCLKDYRQNTKSIAPESGLCGGYAGKNNETAAQIIYKVAQSCGVNPQVIIVMLQKEQGLVTSTRPSSTAYEKAMGAFCPDTAPCDPQYKGFFYQVYYGTHRFKVYRANPNSFNYRAGRNNFILYNPDTSCGGSNVYIQNQATAGLYIYTPYQPNPATLAVGLGVEAPCGAYGNKNFWWLFNNWFGPTTGSPFLRASGDSTVYILGANNNYYRVPDRKTLEIYGYNRTIHSVEVVSTAYFLGKHFSGDLPVVARFQGDEVYLINDGKAHHFTSRDLLRAYGYDIGQEALLSANIQEYFQLSDNMQSVARNADGPEVWLIEGGRKRHIINQEAYHSGSPTYASRPHVTLGSRVASQITNGPPLLTKNKVLKRSDRNTFTFWDGSKIQDISPRFVSELKLSIDYSTRASMIDQLPSRGTTADKLISNSGNNYIVDSRRKLLVDGNTLEHLNIETTSFVPISDELTSRVPTTTKLNRAIRINGGDAVYLIEDGQRHHANDPQALAQKGFSTSMATNVNGSTANLFSDSGRKVLARGTLFRLGQNDKVRIVNSDSSSLHIPSRELMDEYGFSFSKVKSFSSRHVMSYRESGKLDFYAKDSSNNIWLIQNKSSKHPVSATMQTSTYFKINPATVPRLDDSTIGRYVTKQNVTHLLRARGHDKVYRIEDGKKRWITSRSALIARGYSFRDITEVSLAYINRFPSSANIH